VGVRYSIHDPENRRALVARLDRLTPAQPPRWGRMDASRMVRHLIESYRLSTGDLRIRRYAIPLRPLVRWLAIHVLPFPKGAPTARELLARPALTWEADLAQLRAAILAAAPPAPGAPVAEHPLFGAMSVRDWDVLMHKHTDHHLRQFGL
jgi:hypothetical protein